MQALSQQQKSELDTLCLAHCERLVVPALTVTLSDQTGEVLYEGRASDKTHEGESLHMSSRFPIASLTKSFAAAAILKLRDENKLELSDSPSEYVQELATQNNTVWSKRTISDLLSMQSGLPADYFGSWAEQSMELHSTQLSGLLAQPLLLQNPPRTRYAYSNLGYGILGRVIAELSGTSALDFITKHFILPLNLTETSWEAHDGTTAHGFVKVADKWRREPKVFSKGDAGVLGGLFSSHRDLAKWLRFIACYEDQDERVLSISSRLELTAPRILRPIENDWLGRPRYAAYCYGIVRTAVLNTWGFGHSGAVPGFGTYFLWLPTLEVSLVAVANRRYAEIFQLGLDIAEKLVTVFPVSEEKNQLVYDRGIQLLELLTAWSDAKAEALIDSALWKDVSRDELRQRFTELYEIGGSWVVSVESEVSGKISCGDSVSINYHLNPFWPGLIQNID